MANKHTMRYSKSLITREMQMKTPRCHFTLIRVVIIKSKQKTSVGKNMETMEPLYIAGGRVKWYSYYGNNVVVPQKNQAGNYYMTQQFYFWAYIQKNQKQDSKWYPYTHG